MRHIGFLDTEQHAKSLHSYLLTEKVRAMVEEEDGKWAVWIYDEDDVDRGRTELQSFKSNPADPKYASAVRVAERIAKDEEKRRKQAAKQNVDVREQWNKPLLYRSPVTMALMGLAILITVLCSDPQAPWGKGILSFGPELSTRPLANWFHLWAKIPPLTELKSGQVWRAITPIFLHFSFIHILFNLMWTRDLGSAIESRIGTFRFFWFVLFTTVVSVLLTHVFESGRAGGLSGVVYGMAAFVYIKGRYQPELGLGLSSRIMQFFIIWLVIGFSGAIPGMSNFSHLFGMLAGGIYAYFPVGLRKLKRSMHSD